MNSRVPVLAFACLLASWGSAPATEEARGAVIASSTPLARIVRYDGVSTLQIRPQESSSAKNIDVIVAFSAAGLQYELRLRRDESGPRGGGCELYRNGVDGWPELFMPCGPPHYFGTVAIDGVEQTKLSVSARLENDAVLARLVESGETFKFLWLEPKALYDSRAQGTEYIFYSESDLMRAGTESESHALPVWYRHEPRQLDPTPARQAGP